MSGREDPRESAQRAMLLKVLLLNVALMIGLLVAGVWADSSALIANAVDNASDAFVYGLSYFTVAGSKRTKARAAMTSGVLLIVLSIGVVVDVGRRFATGAEPLGPIIIPAALIAVAVNALCLKLLAHDRRGDVNMRAAWTFSINDFVSNFGAMVAGALVLLLGQQWPDLVVGAAVALVALHGGVRIVQDAKRSRRDGSGPRRERAREEHAS